jgi:four helix bundle protein
VAQGSLKELETHLLLSQRLGFAQAQAFEPVLARCAVVGKMLGSLIRAVQRSS